MEIQEVKMKNGEMDYAFIMVQYLDEIFIKGVIKYSGDANKYRMARHNNKESFREQMQKSSLF